MPTLMIEGRKVSVGDAFLKLSPEEKQERVEEIAAQLQIAPKAAAPQEEGYGTSLYRGVANVANSVNATLGTFGITSGDPVMQGPQGPSAAERFINQEGEGYRWGELDEAVAEAVPGMAAVRAGQATGAAVGSFLGPVGTAAGAGIGGTLSGFMQAYGPLAEERARNKGLAEPTVQEMIEVLPTAALSAFLDNFGAGKVGTGVLNTLVKRPLRELATEGAQSINEQSGTTVGTPGGERVSLKQAGGEALIGGGTGAAVNVAPYVAAAPKALAHEARVQMQKGPLRKQASEDPIGFDTDYRVQKAYEAELRGLPGGKSRSVEAMRNLWWRYSQGVEEALAAYKDAGRIDDRDFKTLWSGDAAVFKLAHKTVTEFNEEIDTKRILALDLDDEVKSTLLDAAREMNVLGKQAQRYRAIGPAEEGAQKARSLGRALIGAGTGLQAGGPMGAVAGAAVGLGLPYLGRKIDAYRMAQQPTLVRNAEARSRVAESNGVEAGNTLAHLADMRDDALSSRPNVFLLPRNYLSYREMANHAKQKREEAARVREQKKTGKAAEDAKAAAERLEAEAKKLEEDLALRERMEGLDARLGVIPIGGWRAEIRKYGTDALAPYGRGGVTEDDIRAALNEVVAAGIISPEDAERAMIPGARVNREIRVPGEDRPIYYKLQEVATAIAANRLGIPWGAQATTGKAGAKMAKVPETPEEKAQAVLARQRTKAAVEAAQELEQERQAQQLQAMQAMILARGLTPDQMAQTQASFDQYAARRAEAAARAAETRRKAPRVAPEPAPAPPSGIANPISYQAAVDRAQAIRAAAEQTVPDGLRAYLNGIAEEKTKKGKAALLKEAQEAFPAHKAWIKEHLAPLAKIGGTKGVAKKAEEPEAAPVTPSTPDWFEDTVPTVAEALTKEAEAEPEVKPELMPRDAYAEALDKLTEPISIRDLGQEGQRSLVIDTSGRLRILSKGAKSTYEHIDFMEELSSLLDGSEGTYGTYAKTGLANVTLWTDRDGKSEIGIGVYGGSGLTEAQLRAIAALAKKLGIEDRQLFVDAHDLSGTRIDKDSGAGMDDLRRLLRK